MYKKIFILLFVAFLGFSSTVPRANALEISEVLKRMDAIIVEMQALRVEFASLSNVTNTSISVPKVLGNVASKVLGNDIRFGSTNNDIKRIQTLLATDPTVYPYGVASGYYGPKTQEAIRMFQARFNLDTVGVVGPSTRALLEVFFAAYPDDTYPSDVLKKPKPKLPAVISTQTKSSVQITSVSSNVASIIVTEEDDEFIVKSYKADGVRNRDLILYPKTEGELITMISDKLKITEIEASTLLTKTDFNFSKTKRTGISDATEASASNAIEEARSDIYAVRRAIRNANLDGVNTVDADELYKEGKRTLAEARRFFNDGNYPEAISVAQDVQMLADEANNLL